MESTPRKLALAVIAIAVCGLLAAGCIPPPPGTYGASGHVYVEGPGLPLPPPPPIVLPPAPRVVYAPSLSVYYVEGVGHDVFYSGGYFYTHHSGHWYCTNRPGGSWATVSVSGLPAPLTHGPPRPGWRPPVPGQVREITSFRSSLPPGVGLPPPPPPPRPGAAPSSGRVTVSPSARGQGNVPRAVPAPPGRSPEGPPGRVKSRDSQPPRANPAPPGRSQIGPPGQSKRGRELVPASPGRSRSTPPGRSQSARERGK